MRLTPEMLRVAPFSTGVGAELTKDIQEFHPKGFYMANTSYRVPHITDEIKLRIPVDLDDGHHLLFTFYHISCKPNNKDDEIEYPIGYSWLPLLRDGRLSTGDFNLPICLDRLPASYGYLSPDVALPNVRWLDGHKPVFSVSLRAVSTVHPQDEHLEKFFVAVNSLSSTDRKKPPANEATLIAAAQNVIKARPEPMVAFLYNVLDKLIALIANRPYSESLSSACFETMGQLVKICTMLLDSCLDSHGRSTLLTSYVHYYKIAMKGSSTAKLTMFHLFFCFHFCCSPFFVFISIVHFCCRVEYFLRHLSLSIVPSIRHKMLSKIFGVMW
ncbi:unnamed protein product [Nippostrongylus brasiliensis]|uniref:C2 DOCK-type domain-containing protein n=1 Tax=Nippostrongylus brasiliensis TaxID=27835 RepID=A0A0N4XKQ9_NIPBR|nr:unnamed protein product [Nippostrongylus brasiliensis]